MNIKINHFPSFLRARRHGIFTDIIKNERQYFHNIYSTVPSSENTIEIYFSGFKGCMITGELLSLSQLHFFTLVILLKGKKRGISESLRNHSSHLIAFTLWLNTSSCCRSDPVFSFVGFSQNLSWFIQVCSNYLCADRQTFLSPESWKQPLSLFRYQSDAEDRQITKYNTF